MNTREHNKRPLLHWAELRTLSDGQLEGLLKIKHAELAEQQALRCPRGRGYGGGEVNPGVIKNCKKEIARIRTVMTERNKVQK